MNDLVSKFGYNPDLRTPAQNKGDGAFGLVGQIQDRYNKSSSSVKGAFLAGANAQTGKVVSAITSNEKSGKTQLAADQSRAFVDGYADKKTYGWLADHAGVKPGDPKIAAKKAVFKKEGEAILTKSLKAEGAKAMANYSDKLDNITTQARQIFLDTEGREGPAAGLDAVHDYVEKQSAQIHSEYSNNHLFGHGKGMSEDQAKFAVSASAFAGVASTTNMPDNHSGNGTIGLGLSDLNEHEHSTGGVIARMVGGAGSGLLSSALNMMGYKGVASAAGYAAGKMGAKTPEPKQGELFTFAEKEAGTLGRMGKALAVVGVPLAAVAEGVAIGEPSVQGAMREYFNNHDWAVGNVNAAMPNASGLEANITRRNMTNAKDMQNAPGMGDQPDEQPNAANLIGKAAHGAGHAASDMAGATSEGVLNMVNKLFGG